MAAAPVRDAPRSTGELREGGGLTHPGPQGVSVRLGQDDPSGEHNEIKNAPGADVGGAHPSLSWFRVSCAEWNRCVCVQPPPSLPTSPQPTSLNLFPLISRPVWFRPRPSLPGSLPPWLPPSLAPSLPGSLPDSLTHSFAHSLTHSLTHSLPHSLTHSLAQYVK